MKKSLVASLFLLACPIVAHAAVFGIVRGIVHDPQHRPVQLAEIKLRALTSDWQQTAETNQDGEFRFMTVPIGEYSVTASHDGFNAVEQRISVHSGEAPILHLPLTIAAVKLTVEVAAAPELTNPESSTTENIVARRQIEQMPGASGTNSMAMITNLVPGAFVIHDQLHIRGGHQVSWLVDGVPVPNTNISSNVGPQFDPKDIDYLEVQRGGYKAEYGDRTYGVFNVVPRSGFERNSQAELVLNYGNFHQSNDQLSLGGHTQRLAYYASLTGNRTDLGLQPPGPEVGHDRSSSVGGFTSLIYNPRASDQIRMVASIRGDDYQVPNVAGQQSAGTDDVQNERDAFLNFSWVRTLDQGKVLTVSPLYHRNRAAFWGGTADTPVSARDDRTSTYAGGNLQLSVVTRKHNLRAGLFGMGQEDNQLFTLRPTDGSGQALEQHQTVRGSLEALFVEDQFKLTSWFTLNGGMRWTHFSGLLAEKAASPRIGAAIRLPGLNWVWRAFYGRYYQAPPLSTVSGPILEFALAQGFDFLPLRGERDEQREVGLTIPFRGWSIDLSNYRTHARNFFDHDVLGNSNIFFPVTIAIARLRGWEGTVESPQLFRHTRLHMVFSRQFAEGQGAVTGGLTDFRPPEDGRFLLDHDQRYTFSGGFETKLPWMMWASGNVSYGSGFLDGDGPAHMTGHTTVDLSVNKSLRENLSVTLSALNLADRRYLLDNSNTFGGTHYSFPRQISITLRYCFHY